DSVNFEDKKREAVENVEDRARASINGLKKTSVVTEREIKDAKREAVENVEDKARISINRAGRGQ
ncbi:8977_t:CDS:1, partial [Racocetra fulgida]